MQIESLTAENLEYLIELVAALWTDCDIKEEHETYKSILTSNNEACFLAKEKGTYIAFIHLGIHTDYVEGASAFPVAYIEGLFVKPSHQKSGIGKMLAAKAEDWGRQKGCKEIASDTECSNLDSIAFHKKIGFEEANRIVCFIKKI